MDILVKTLSGIYNSIFIIQHYVYKALELKFSMFKHYTQSTILIEEDNTTIIIDPFNIKDKDLPIADILLISHPHKDHYSIEDINSISSINTTIVSSCDIDTISYSKEHIKLVPNQTIQINNISITATPAYNIDKEFHPKKNNWLGFHIQTPTTSYYFIGDSDNIEEFSNFSHADVAFIPISGTYVMNVEEAVEATIHSIKPKLAIPCHFGEVVGTIQYAQKFVEIIKRKGIDAKVIKEE